LPELGSAEFIRLRSIIRLFLLIIPYDDGFRETSTSNRFKQHYRAYVKSVMDDNEIPHKDRHIFAMTIGVYGASILDEVNDRIDLMPSGVFDKLRNTPIYQNIRSGQANTERISGVESYGRDREFSEEK